MEQFEQQQTRFKDTENPHGFLTCSVGSRVWSDTGTLATRGMQMQLLQELRRRTKHSSETEGLIHLDCLFQSFSVSLMGQLMVFTVSIIKADKKPSPECNYWTEMRKPYYSNSTAEEFCAMFKRGTYLLCRWWRPPVPSQRRRTWLAETQRLLWAGTGPVWSL